MEIPDQNVLDDMGVDVEQRGGGGFKDKYFAYIRGPSFCQCTDWLLAKRKTFAWNELEQAINQVGLAPFTWLAFQISLSHTACLFLLLSPCTSICLYLLIHMLCKDINKTLLLLWLLPQGWDLKAELLDMYICVLPMPGDWRCISFI